MILMLLMQRMMLMMVLVMKMWIRMRMTWRLDMSEGLRVTPVRLYNDNGAQRMHALGIISEINCKNGRWKYWTCLRVCWSHLFDFIMTTFLSEQSRSFHSLPFSLLCSTPYLSPLLICTIQYHVYFMYTSTNTSPLLIPCNTVLSQIIAPYCTCTFYLHILQHHHECLVSFTKPNEARPPVK